MSLLSCFWAVRLILEPQERCHMPCPAKGRCEQGTKGPFNSHYSLGFFCLYIFIYPKTWILLPGITSQSLKSSDVGEISPEMCHFLHGFAVLTCLILALRQLCCSLHLFAVTQLPREVVSQLFLGKNVLKMSLWVFWKERIKQRTISIVSLLVLYLCLDTHAQIILWFYA